jgi:hypothetical protein
MSPEPPRLQDMLADAVIASAAMLSRYLAGFDDHNRTRQAPGLPNHAAWCLGHLALTMHRASERFGGEAVLPTLDFNVGSPRGDSSRFGTESVGFGSTPVDDPSCYPEWARCVAIFEAATQRLATAIRSASDAAIMKPLPFFGGESLCAWHAAPRIVFHNGTHCGQLADLRRALGMGSIFA